MYYLTKYLQVLELGDEFATTLGIRVNLVRLVLVLSAVFLIAFATSATGPIAFVAFLAGPIASKMVGQGSPNVLASGLVGALLVLGSDMIGQFVFSTRFPVGVITGILGAPYMLFLLIGVNRRGEVVMNNNQHSFEGKNIVTGYDKKIIIDGVDITIPSNKISVIIGSNGCGKSTLLKTLARLIKPISGDIVIDGKKVTSMPSKQLAKVLGLLPQSPVVPEGITVWDLVSRGRFPYQTMLKKYE